MTYNCVAEVWNPFFIACSLALFKTVSKARAFDKSPDSFNLPVMNAVAGASSPKNNCLTDYAILYTTINTPKSIYS